MTTEAGDEKWSKAQRLHVAGSVAPHLRDQHDQIKGRRVARIDADGKVVGYTTLAEVQKALLAKAAIEFDVIDGHRPKEAICERCGLPAKVRKRARVSGSTIRCDKCTFLSCEDCGKKLPRNYSAPSMIAKTGGTPTRTCIACQKKRTAANISRCFGCEKPMSRKAEWQHRVKFKRTDPLRCKPCATAAREKLPLPRCSLCDSELAAGARYGVRAKKGLPPMCSGCYRGDVRVAVAREKMAADPSFAKKVKRAMANGLRLAKESRVKRLPCSDCGAKLGDSASRPRKGYVPRCRPCAQKHRWATIGKKRAA